jgi:hypothetical protein
MPSPSTLITPPRVEFIDQRSGFVSREWYQFFLTLFRLTGSGQNTTSLEDLQVGPSFQNLFPAEDNVLPLASTELQAQISALQNELEALALVPPNPGPQRLHYASFHDTTTQNAAVINTAYAITINTTDIAEGIRIGSPTSRVIVNDAGVYNFQFSLQATTTSASSHYMYVWARVNGTDVPDSATRVEFKGAGGDQVLAWNFVLQMAANDYFELMWSVTDTAISIASYATIAPAPAIPSIILTVCEVTI